MGMGTLDSHLSYGNAVGMGMDMVWFRNRNCYMGNLVPADLYIVLTNWPNHSLCYQDSRAVCLKLVLCYVQFVQLVYNYSHQFELQIMRSGHF